MNKMGRWTTYLICVGLFLAGMLIYFHPTLQGKIVQKDDHLNSQSNSQEIYEHREKFEDEPLWTNSQFGGMPTFQMTTAFKSNLIADVKNFLTKSYFPSSIGLIFTLFIGFFIMLLVMGVDPWLALIGSFAYAFSTYFITSYEAGHTGKLRVIGFMAPSIATIFLALRGKWILGGSLTAFTVCAALSSNHLQINYYLALLITLIMVVEGFMAFKEGRLSPYFFSAGTLLLAAILAIGPNISSIWSTYSYSQETIRGGSSPLEKEKGEDGSGLDKDYAMRWSYGKMETFNLLIPSFYGEGSNSYPGEDSHTANALQQRGVQGHQLEQVLKRFPLYWGEQPFTAGPNYLGAVICFLFVGGLFLVNGPVRWWVIVASAFSIMMAWGKHFPILNDFLFEYLPFYSKFRSPSMILTIVCFTAPLLGILATQELIRRKKDPETLKKLRWAFYTTGGICLFFALVGPSLFDFEGRMNQRLNEREQQLIEAREQAQGEQSQRVQQQLQQIQQQKRLYENLKEDRASLLQKSSIRSLAFIGLAFLAIWAFAKGHIQQRVLFLGLGTLIVVDLWAIDKRFLNEEDFTDPDRRTPRQFRLSKADQQILQGKKNAFYPDPQENWTTPSQHYRVYNATASDPFSDAFTSYHHHSIGGYHAAKLTRYQDLIERHLRNGTPQVLNMLNTRWVIRKDQDSEQGGEMARRNPGALGNAWFVEELRWENSANDVIDALDDIQPKKTAVVHEDFRPYFEDKEEGSHPNGSSIDLTFYKANELRYQANVKGNRGHLAVFSEMYYEGSGEDWKVWIDGEEVPHIRVNYALRGLWIPPGEHEVRFEFRPPSYFQGERIALTSSIIVFLLIILAILYEVRKTSKRDTSDPEGDQLESGEEKQE